MKQLNKTNSSRLNYLDSLKGFAIILVVLAHVAEKFYKFDLYPETTEIYELCYNLIYSFHMPLFMMISGFIFAKAYFSPSFEEREASFNRRIWDFAIVYTWFSIFTGITKIIFADDILHPLKPLDILLIWVKPIGHMWYLYAMIIINFLIVAFRKVLLKYQKISLFLFTALSIGITILSKNIESDLFAYFDICRVIKHLLNFYIGILLFTSPKLFIFNNVFKYSSLIAACILAYLRWISPKPAVNLEWEGGTSSLRMDLA